MQPSRSVREAQFSQGKEAPAPARALALQRTKRPALGLNGRFVRLVDRRGHRARLGIRLANINATLEESAVLDADAGGGHVAGQGTLGANIGASCVANVALHLAQNHDFAGGDASGHLTVGGHSEAVAGKVNAALDLAVYEQRFGARDFTFDVEAFANGGLFTGGCWGGGGAGGFKRRGWGHRARGVRRWGGGRRA